MITMSEEIGKVSAALVRAQYDVEVAIKASTNPHYGSSYADLTSVLGVIKPALATNGLAMVQYPGYGGNIVTMITVLIHESGEWIQSPVAAIPITKQDPHGATSGVTYLRRTCASSLMALIADDDDGNAAVGPTPKPTKPTKPTRGAPLGRPKSPKSVKSTKPAAEKKQQDALTEANHVGERLAVLEAIIAACEEHGGVDERALNAAQQIVEAFGPLDRVEKAIKHLELEVSRG
jgi:hypothetical protein